MKKDDLPILTFKDQKEFEIWMAKNHDTSPGVWIRIYKKATGKETISHELALDVALCYGWIDSQANGLDEQSHIQKFTPRRAKGIWSKRNTEHIERLIAAGKMKPEGMKQVEEAKADGRWDAAYSAPSEMVMPEDFLKELQKDKKAFEFFQTLNKSNTYAIGWRLQTAKKPETREKRMKIILEMLSKGEKFH